MADANADSGAGGPHGEVPYARAYSDRPKSPRSKFGFRDKASRAKEQVKQKVWGEDWDSYRRGSTSEKAKRDNEQAQQTLFKLQESDRRLSFQRQRRESLKATIAALPEDEELGEDWGEDWDSYEQILDGANRKDIKISDAKPNDSFTSLEKLQQASASGSARDKQLENSKRVGSLRVRVHEETIKTLQQQLSETQTNYKNQLEQSHSENESLKAEADTYKTKYERLGTVYGDLMGKMAIFAKEELASHNEQKDAELEQWKEKHNQMGQSYDELLKMVEDLATENGNLTVKCHQLEHNETNLKEELIAMEDLQVENEALQESIKAMEEAVQYASGMSETMEVFVEAHEADVKGYEKKLATLNVEKMRAIVKGKVLQRELNELRKDSSQGNSK